MATAKKQAAPIVVNNNNNNNNGGGAPTVVYAAPVCAHAWGNKSVNGCQFIWCVVLGGVMCCCIPFLKEDCYNYTCDKCKATRQGNDCLR